MINNQSNNSLQKSVPYTYIYKNVDAWLWKYERGDKMGKMGETVLLNKASIAAVEAEQGEMIERH